VLGDVSDDVLDRPDATAFTVIAQQGFVFLAHALRPLDLSPGIPCRGRNAMTESDPSDYGVCD